MRFPQCGVLFACLLALATSMLLGCNNTLNPLCSSARPAPVIASISPATISFAEVEQGAVLTVNGSQFVSSSEVVINTKPLAATVINPRQLQVKLSTDIIAAPGQVKVMVQTPSGNSGDVGCTSGGNSSVLMLMVN
jgi:hypothetical protein